MNSSADERRGNALGNRPCALRSVEVPSGRSIPPFTICFSHKENGRPAVDTICVRARIAQNRRDGIIRLLLSQGRSVTLQSEVQRRLELILFWVAWGDSGLIAELAVRLLFHC